MTSFEATVPPVAPTTSVPSVNPSSPPNMGRFLGSEGTFFGLLVRGGLLLMVTLGIYRFWLTTDIRRFLWGNTEVAGDSFEYNGTAKELLIGFLIAIVLLVPINGVLFIATFMPEILPYAGTAGFILLALLGQFAFYRARRYRLTRTIYRGVRFYQTGSAWNYSIRSNLWSVLIALTAGLAYPWAQASLERYKMRHTHFGNLEGRFVGSGTVLFLRGIVLWLIIVGPALAGLIGTIVNMDWAALVTAVTSGDGAVTRVALESPALASALGWLTAGVFWAIFVGLILYPVFRAMVTRWWISGVRLGPIEAKSMLRTGQIYRVYLRFIGYSFLFGLALSALAFPIGGLYMEISNSIQAPDALAIAGIVLAVIAYVVMMLGYSTIYQGTVTIRLWRLSFETTALSGLEALDTVQAAGEASGAFGEGLADALDVGGL